MVSKPLTMNSEERLPSTTRVVIQTSRLPTRTDIDEKNAKIGTERESFTASQTGKSKTCFLLWQWKRLWFSNSGIISRVNLAWKITCKSFDLLAFIHLKIPRNMGQGKLGHICFHIDMTMVPGFDIMMESDVTVAPWVCYSLYMTNNFWCDFGE